MGRKWIFQRKNVIKFIKKCYEYRVGMPVINTVMIQTMFIIYKMHEKFRNGELNKSF